MSQISEHLNLDPFRLVTSSQMQAMDLNTIQNIGIPSLVLMENAARSWIEAIRPALYQVKRIFVLCGAGNNGGDGYAIARILKNHGKECSVVSVLPPKSEDCKTNSNIWNHFGETYTWDEFQNQPIEVQEKDLWIDAVFGTGVDRAVTGKLADIFYQINESPAKIFSVDVASGVNATTGDVLGSAIQADTTVTFQVSKFGQFLYPGKQFSGSLVCKPISILRTFQNDETAYYQIHQDLMEQILPKRSNDTYKNRVGHLATICGSEGTIGAGLLASKAGLKAGAGLVTASLPEKAHAILLNFAPEIMTSEQSTVDQDWFEQFQAVVIGCGYGREQKRWDLIHSWLQNITIPTVLDADAFHGITDWEFLQKGNFVLTPHAGEFAKMSGFPKPTTNAERIQQGQSFAKQYKTILVLKGAPTLVFDTDGSTWVNTTGNAGMATAGSGDVLAGIIGSFLSQGLSTLEAALAGTWIHGKSGDLAKQQQGMESLSATSLIDFLGKAFYLS